MRNRFFSRMWVRMKDVEEQVENRRRNLAGLSGRVIELGAGDGRNFALYPPEVTEVGLKLAVAPAGRPLALRLTVPADPVVTPVLTA